MFVLSSARRAALVLILAAASWGLGTVVAKRALAEVAPITLLAIQLGSSVLVLSFLMRWRRIPFRDPAASPVLGRLGLLNPGLAYAFSLLGLVSISASLSVLLWALEPLLILMLAALALRERLTGVLGALSVLAIAGLSLVIATPDTSGRYLGVLLTMAGVACCAVYTVVARRWIGTAESTAQVVVAQQAHAFVLALALVGALALAGGGVFPENVTTIGFASAVGSGVLYFGLAYWLYLSGLRHLPASVASASFYLVPVFGIAGGFLLLGERLTPGQWLGVAVVALAVVGILRWTAATGPALHGLSVSAEPWRPPT